MSNIKLHRLFCKSKDVIADAFDTFELLTLSVQPCGSVQTV